MELLNFANLHHLLKNTKLRLKAEYGWDDDFINMAINEYGRFLILHKLQPKGKIVPGKVVDKVWHDHILHTREYIDFCKLEFGDFLHHDPKNQSSIETNDLIPTLELYEKSFGHPAPSKFWLEDIIVKTKVCNHSTTAKVTTPTKSYTASCCRCG